MEPPTQPLPALSLSILFHTALNTVQSTTSFVIREKVRAEKKIKRSDLQTLAHPSIGRVTIGHKTVYSWNELVITAVGNPVSIISEMEGQNMTEEEESLPMISSHDIRTCKHLESVEVQRAY